MSQEGARSFFSALNASPDLQRAVLGQGTVDLVAVAEEQGFEVTEAELRDVYAADFGSTPVEWLGHKVWWDPSIGESGSIVIGQATDGELSDFELELAVGGSGGTSFCHEPCQQQPKQG